MNTKIYLLRDIEDDYDVDAYNSVSNINPLSLSINGRLNPMFGDLFMKVSQQVPGIPRQRITLDAEFDKENPAHGIGEVKSLRILFVCYDPLQDMYEEHYHRDSIPWGSTYQKLDSILEEYLVSKGFAGTSFDNAEDIAAFLRKLAEFVPKVWQYFTIEEEEVNHD